MRGLAKGGLRCFVDTFVLKQTVLKLPPFAKPENVCDLNEIGTTMTIFSAAIYKLEEPCEVRVSRTVP